MTTKELRFLRRVSKDVVYRPPIRLLERLQAQGWPIQLERPLHEPPLAYVERVHETKFFAMLKAAEAAGKTN